MERKRASIGIDIGGGSVKLGLVTEQGKLLARRVFKTRDYPNRNAQIEAMVKESKVLLEIAREKKLKVMGVGAGAPGPINVEKGLVYFFPNIPGWKNAPLKKLLSSKLGLPVKIDNDANAMALAEFRFGAGKGCTCAVALTLGTGIGGGLLIGGKLFHGPNYSAAEIGHVIINENGTLCACGNRGCIEAYVGTRYFIDAVKKKLAAGAKTTLNKQLAEGQALTPFLVKEAARKGDAFSQAFWRETGAHLGTALAGLVNVLNPEKIILGGGIAEKAVFLFESVQKTIREKSFPVASRSVKVVPAKFGEDAGIIGAAALIF